MVIMHQRLVDVVQSFKLKIMSGRITLRNRVKAQESKSMTLEAAQKKTGQTNKVDIINVLSEKHSSVRYHGKTRTFYYN